MLVMTAADLAARREASAAAEREACVAILQAEIDRFRAIESEAYRRGGCASRVDVETYGGKADDLQEIVDAIRARGVTP